MVKRCGKRLRLILECFSIWNCFRVQPYLSCNQCTFLLFAGCLAKRVKLTAPSMSRLTVTKKRGFLSSHFSNAMQPTAAANAYLP